MRRFGTQGPVNPQEHYVVSRTEEIADYIKRVEQGKYVVLFAPRQTGKTTFFQAALDALTVGTVTNTAGTQSESASKFNYFPIQLNFDVYKNTSVTEFYDNLYQDICEEIEKLFQRRDETQPEALSQLLANTKLTNHHAMRRFFRHLERLLTHQKFVIIIDEFDGIPQAALSDFLHTLRHIYISGKPRCPHSVGIVGVKSIAQLNYDRSISPFNIQDEFHLPNFTPEQVQELLGQYMDEVGQSFALEVITSIHKQTAGQPVLVNRFAQILTEELDIPKTESITLAHFSKAHAQLLEEDNTNFTHLLTNIRRDPRFEKLLMRIMEREDGVDFNLRSDVISELATYGVIARGVDGMCEIVNPIYLYCILQAFKAVVNGLEDEYLSEGNSEGFLGYLTPAGHIDMQPLLDNFRDFITRVGFRILQVPDTPQESVGRHLLLAYLDQFVKIIGGFMHIEVQTGRGRMDIIITHNQQKYIVETKIWRGDNRYQAGKKQLAVYLNTEGVKTGYYIVFDHRENPEPRVETETIAGLTIRSYVIPVLQELPSGSPIGDIRL
ncbi:MAG: AAA-like domain-containing protein [Candidatus Poribacteria bacterium]|nr:AAA-like domain-containing protein [Candidatus Poribacteria bacterium]